ncbi:hypothetical protein [Flavobacterium litorale]|uniref:Uncharacterized protein n=1 Tax=Flavobacterium litorale TaxID=2856519 RepID=A0ABX8V6J8_9FLAO|nr:hypothetical protein [Flavobacterium litorale]QYJ67748.1 hypothetical protein K1I41_09370 [Flavobacterium litorale]
MKYFETPVDYFLTKNKDNIVVSIVNNTEIAQGGPVIGDLKINNAFVDQRYIFGGPIIIDNEFVYCTVFIRGSIFKSSGFKIVKINTLSLDLFFVGAKESLIWLQKIEENKIFFRKSLYGNLEDVYFINDF